VSKGEVAPVQVYGAAIEHIELLDASLSLSFLCRHSFPPVPLPRKRTKRFLTVCLKAPVKQAVQKGPDARRAKLVPAKAGIPATMRLDISSAAVTKDERNAADGPFSTAC
jgi:hypothetical protein